MMSQGFPPWKSQDKVPLASISLQVLDKEDSKIQHWSWGPDGEEG